MGIDMKIAQYILEYEKLSPNGEKVGHKDTIEFNDLWQAVKRAQLYRIRYANVKLYQLISIEIIF